MERGVTEKKSTRITFRLTPSEVHNLHYISQLQNKNISEIIREALKKTCKI